jgi:midasin
LASETNNCFRRVNHNGGTTTEDIIGKLLVNKEGTYWFDGVLIEAMKKGWWYLADEINAASPEVNFIYHSLLDDDGYVVLNENKGEVIRPHKNFRFFGAMNPSADYVGVKELNKALMSRFVVIKTDFPSPASEKQILKNRTWIKSEPAEKIIKFASEVRDSHARDKTNFVLSTRDLIMWASLYEVYGKYIPSAEMSVLNKVNPEDFESIKDLLSLHFRTLDNPKLAEKEKAKAEEDAKKVAEATNTTV